MTCATKARSRPAATRRAAAADLGGAAAALRSAGAALLFLGLLAVQSRAGADEPPPDRPVDLELVLAVDVSASVDEAEYRLQTLGLAAAFRDPAVIAAISAAGDQGIAVTLVQWGVGLEQRQAVGWTHLRDPGSAAAFADAVLASPRLFVGNGTSISHALLYAAGLFEENGFAGRRRVIDLSGDGRNNSGPAPGAARDRVLARGITVNGLAIRDRDRGLGRYFAEHVIGGTASFVVVADDFSDFPRAIRRKLLREIQAPLSRRQPGAKALASLAGTVGGGR